MKSKIISIIAFTTLTFAGATLAVDMPAVGKKRCGACHSVDKKKMGPAFIDIAAKYKGDKNAAKNIAHSITKGGSFGWKLGKMPPKGMGAKKAEIETMAKFIAGLKK